MSIAKTRQKLIEVARELFARKGIEGTTMNDIATTSQKGRRTLYTYFRNKEEVFAAVIEDELEHLSEEMDKVVSLPLPPDIKVVKLSYSHLSVIKAVVKRVEKARRKFDLEEISALRSILREGLEKGVFHIDHLNLTADVIHYAVKGIEVPFMFDRLGEGLSMEDSVGVVERLLQRSLGATIPSDNS